MQRGLLRGASARVGEGWSREAGRCVYIPGVFLLVDEAVLGRHGRAGGGGKQHEAGIDEGGLPANGRELRTVCVGGGGGRRRGIGAGNHANKASSKDCSGWYQEMDGDRCGRGGRRRLSDLGGESGGWVVEEDDEGREREAKSSK